MQEPMTRERAYQILGVKPGASLREISLSFRTLREKYDPERHPGHGKELTEAIGAFELLQMETSSR